MTNEQLATRVEQLEAQIRLTSTLWRWRFVYPLVAVFVSMFVAVGVNIAYTTSTVHRSEQSWCKLVTGLDDQNQRTPPPTENGKVFARSLHELRVAYRCK